MRQETSKFWDLVGLILKGQQCWSGTNLLMYTILGYVASTRGMDQRHVKFCKMCGNLFYDHWSATSCQSHDRLLTQVVYYTICDCWIAKQKWDLNFSCTCRLLNVKIFKKYSLNIASRNSSLHSTVAHYNDAIMSATANFCLRFAEFSPFLAPWLVSPNRTNFWSCFFEW